eukprot:6208879-Pleurochrysis_carterae.AAC.1
MLSRSRTGGGPLSGTLAAKNLLTENVEQGGEAMTAPYALAVQRSSSRVYTESSKSSCRCPPPSVGWLSINSASKPA